MKVISYDKYGYTVYRPQGFPKLDFNKWLNKLKWSLIKQYKHSEKNAKKIVYNKELEQYWFGIWCLAYTPSEGVQYFNHLCKDCWDWDFQL